MHQLKCRPIQRCCTLRQVHPKHLDSQSQALVPVRVRRERTKRVLFSNGLVQGHAASVGWSERLRTMAGNVSVANELIFACGIWALIDTHCPLWRLRCRLRLEPSLT